MFSRLSVCKTPIRIILSTSPVAIHPPLPPKLNFLSVPFHHSLQINKLSVKSLPIPMLLSWVGASYTSHPPHTTFITSINVVEKSSSSSGKACQRTGGKRGTSLVATIDGHFLFNRFESVCILEQRKKVNWMVHWLILKFFSVQVCVDMARHKFIFISTERGTGRAAGKSWGKVFESFSLCTWHNPTENCPNSGICRRISSVTKWTPLCWGRKLILRWNQAEPICIPLLVPLWLEFEAIAVELNYDGKKSESFLCCRMKNPLMSFPCSPFGSSSKKIFYVVPSLSHFLRVLSLSYFSLNFFSCLGPEDCIITHKS